MPISIILSFLKGTWKIWVPILMVLVLSGTIYGQYRSIVKLASKVKITEYQLETEIEAHDQAMKENARILADSRRTEAIFAKRDRVRNRQARELADAHRKIIELKDEASRTLLDTRLPDSILAELQPYRNQDSETISADSPYPRLF